MYSYEHRRTPNKLVYDIFPQGFAIPKGVNAQYMGSTVLTTEVWLQRELGIWTKDCVRVELLDGYMYHAWNSAFILQFVLIT